MPTLANSFNVNSSAQNLSTLTSSSFTPAVGDVIVVKGILENAFSGSSYGTPSDTNGHTYTQRGVDNTSFHCWVGLWTAVVVTASSMTVSVTPVGTNNWHSIVVEQWTSAGLASPPATNGTVVGSGAPSTTITTTGTSSAVSWLNGDWAANSPTGRVYDTTSGSPVEDGLHDKSGTGSYVGYYAYQNTASPGSQTVGLTAPGGQTWSLLAVEVLDAGGGGGAGGTDPDQFGTLAWQ